MSFGPYLVLQKGCGLDAVIEPIAVKRRLDHIGSFKKDLVERQNGIKKWIFSARKMAVSGETMDMILRIFCNSPPINAEEAKDWCRSVAIRWWSNGERQIECQELDQYVREHAE